MKMAKTKSKSKKAGSSTKGVHKFPAQVFVQQEYAGDDAYLRLDETVDEAADASLDVTTPFATGERVAIYKLDRIVTLKATTNVTETPFKG